MTTMASLVEKMRSGSETWETVQVHGFDPDIQTCGHATLLAHYRTDIRGIFKISAAVLGRIDAANKKLTGVNMASAMVDAIQGYSLVGTAYSFSFIESQQVYPDPNMDRGEMVAKANDLLRLAHVAGAYHIKALNVGHVCQVLLPAEWKGNRPKPAMHATVVDDIRAHQAVEGNPFKVREKGSLVSFAMTDEWREEKKNFHTMDALCLAYKGLLRVVQGVCPGKKGT
jgi:hypothetical protein